jgi:hypothetical protein
MKRDPNMKQIPLPLSEKEFANLVKSIDFKSVIGHPELAEYLSDKCGVDIPFNRKGIRVSYDDYIILCSMNGRLPEHPIKVDYEGRLNYAFMRFEKQTIDDTNNTMAIIKKITEAV